MNLRNKYVIAAVAAALVIAAVYGLWDRGGRDGGDKQRDQAVLVTVAKVVPRSFVDVIEAIGTAKANESVDITAKSTDTVGGLNFTDGQKVDKGFIIAEMTSREQSADLGAARAGFNQSEKDYTRISELSKKGYATKAQLDSALAARDAALARVKSLESRVSDRLMRAPFAGVLGLRRVSVGSLVRPGDVITTLDDISLIKLDFTVPEAFMGSLNVGAKVEVGVAAYPGRAFTGKVAGIDTRVDPVTRAVALRAEIDNPDGMLKPGMLMTVRLLSNERTTIGVPEQSLVPLEDKQYVYVVGADKKAERREVKIGAREPGVVEVRDGLKAGETVVVDGTLKLRPGATVRLVGEKPKGRPERDGEGSRS